MANDFYTNVKHKVTISNTQADLRQLAKTGWPKEIARTFAIMARRSREKAETRTRNVFNLKTDWIARGIMAIPTTPSQVQAAERALARHGDMFAAVYLRGTADPKNSLQFMTDHEEGATRRPHKGNKAIARPMPGVQKRARTGTGKLRDRYAPQTLLEAFRKAGSTYTNGTTITRSFGWRRGPGKAKIPGNYFIIKSKRGTPIIVRRKTRGGTKVRGASTASFKDNIRSRNRAKSAPSSKPMNLEFIYALDKSERIKPRYKFGVTVFDEVRASYQTLAPKMYPRFKAKAKA